jgi:hypothetical protein
VVDLGRSSESPAARLEEVFRKTENHWLSSKRSIQNSAAKLGSVISIAVDFHTQGPSESQPSPRMLRPVP